MNIHKIQNGHSNEITVKYENPTYIKKKVSLVDVCRF